MPWQQEVADVGLELLPDGRPAYRDVGLTVPRQSGKTTLTLSWEVQRALGWAEILQAAQTMVYSAQTGKDARRKLLEDQWPLLLPHKRTLGIKSHSRSNGFENVKWSNGSSLWLLSSGTDSGHGPSLDFGVRDELFADTDNRREQALSPAMATRPYAQVLSASTAGTADSFALNAMMTEGRAAAELDTGKGVAYFEWSAHPEEDDPADPATWWRCMPALGRTITLEVIEHAYAKLELEEFKRAYLNIPTASLERVIPAAAWLEVCRDDVEATAGAMAFDVNPERSAAAIVAAGDGPIVEVLEYRPGTAWLVDRIVDLHRAYGVAFAVDRAGPAGTFVAQLEDEKVPVVEVDPRGMAHASAQFYDAVVDGAVAVLRYADLDLAVAGAAKRPVGDAWRWDRKSAKVDISTLVAASLALATWRAGPGGDPANNVW